MKRLIFIAAMVSGPLAAQTFVQGPALIEGREITVTSGGTKTLTKASQTYQIFTGSSAHTLVLPVAATLPIGRRVEVVNQSSSAVSVNDSAAVLQSVVYPGQSESFYLKDTAWAVINDMSTNWSLLGNIGTNPSTNFLGSADAQDIVLRTNNVERLRVLSTGEIGVGNSSPIGDTISLFKGIGGGTDWTGVENTVSVTSSGAAAFHQGAYNAVRFSHPTGTVDLGRNYDTCEMNGDGIVTECYGSRAIARLYDFNAPSDTSSGRITSAYGLEAYVGNVSTGGGIIRNAVGVYISRAHATGSDGGGGAHIATGLKIDNVVASGGDSNTAWAIDTAGSSGVASRFDGDILPATSFSRNLGSYSFPWGLWTGGLRVRGNGFSILLETNNLGSDYTLRFPDNYTANKVWLTGTSGNSSFGNVDLSSMVTGNLPVANLNSGTGATASTFWRGDGTWGTPVGAVTSVGVSVPATSIFGVTGSPVTGAGTIDISTTGISGGIPFFSSTSQIASSAVLAANRITLGGGAGVAPVSLGSLGTTTTVLKGNAAGAPTFGAVVLTTDISGILPLANGGTNKNMVVANGGVVWTDADSQEVTAAGTAGQVLTSNGASAPSWSNSGGGFSANNSVSLAASGSISIVTTSAGILQHWRIQGSTAAVTTLSTTPFGATDPVDRALICVAGVSNDNPIVIPTSDIANGVVGNGDTLINRFSSACFRYLATEDRFVIESRSP